MKKSILNLKGAQILTKEELKETAGGKVFNPGGGDGPGEDGCGFNTCRNQWGRCSWAACDRGY